MNGLEVLLAMLLTRLVLPVTLLLVVGELLKRNEIR